MHTYPWMVAQTRRISPGSGLNVGTAMPCARPVRPAWSEPSPRARNSTSGLEFVEERVDAALDVVAYDTHLGERPPHRVGQVPVLVALARHDGARAVTRGDDDVGPLDQLVVELAWNVVRGVDARFAECSDDDVVHLRPGRRAR